MLCGSSALVEVRGLNFKCLVLLFILFFVLGAVGTNTRIEFIFFSWDFVHALPKAETLLLLAFAVIQEIASS